MKTSMVEDILNFISGFKIIKFNDTFQCLAKLSFDQDSYFE